MKGLRAVAVALAAFAGVTSAAGAQPIGDAGAGEAVFGKCRGCHEVGDAARHKTGPSLNGLFGRAAGKAEGFRYSEAMVRAGDKGLVWHAQELDSFLERPRQIVPKTRMSFAGLSDAKDRADLIAYLRTFSQSPANYPEADPTAAPTDHDVSEEILAIQGDPEYGEYLSSECTTCHQVDGSDDGIPSIVNWAEDDFVIAMQAYKRQVRLHPVMNMVAGRLNDEEIASLASYFAGLGR